MPLHGEAAVLDCLMAMRRPGESYSDVIVRIAGETRRGDRLYWEEGQPHLLGESSTPCLSALSATGRPSPGGTPK